MYKIVTGTNVVNSSVWFEKVNAGNGDKTGSRHP
jgi:hypothetical protein